jgi:hypothetical protein
VNDGDNLCSVPVAGGTETTLVGGGAVYPGQLAEASGELYWSDFFANKVWQVTTTGTTPAVLASSNGPAGIAVAAGDVYWGSDNGAGEVMDVAATGGTPVTFASNQVGVSALAANSSYVAWVEHGNPAQVVVKNRSSSQSTTLASISNNCTCAYGVALDSTNVYWAWSAGAFQAPISGGSPITLATTAGLGVAVDSSGVYIAEQTSILWAPIGGGTTTTLYSRGANIGGIAVDAASVYWVDYTYGVLKVAKP